MTAGPRDHPAGRSDHAAGEQGRAAGPHDRPAREHDHPAGVRVRLVAPHEHDAVARLSLDAYSHDYVLSDTYAASLVDVSTRARDAQVWVAEDLATGALLGTVATPRPGEHISPLGRDGELDFRLLAVAPAARGQGIGALLTRFVVELARQRGLHRVVMNSGPRMTAAHRLYHRLGFVRLTDRETRVVEGGTLLAFGLDVAPAPAAAPARPGRSWYDQHDRLDEGARP